MIRQFEIKLSITFDRNMIWRLFWCQTVLWILRNMLNFKCQFWYCPQRASLARVGSQMINKNERICPQTFTGWHFATDDSSSSKQYKKVCLCHYEKKTYKNKHLKIPQKDIIVMSTKIPWKFISKNVSNKLYKIKKKKKNGN